MRRITLCCLAIVLFAAAPLHAQPDSLWSRTYGGGGNDDCYSLVQTADGGYALAGVTSSFGAGSRDFWLVRTDENGDSLWSCTYGGGGTDVCNSLVQTADGGFALAGETESFGAGDWDFWLVRTNENGDSLWSHTYGGVDFDGCYSLVQTADRGFALAGTTHSFGAGSYDFWLVRTDESGDSFWSHTYGDTEGNSCYSLVLAADGGFALGGEGFELVRADENGNSLWFHTYGGGGDVSFSDLYRTADETFALAGSIVSFGAGGADFWLVKLGPENSVPDDGATTPLHFGLDGVYPNPFNAQAVSSYKLQVSSWMSLCLYDLRGQLVETLTEGWQEAGEHRVVIDANGGQARMPILPSGIYLLRLSDASHSALSKVCLVR